MKLSDISTAAVDANTTLVGVQNVAGVFTDKRYTIAALITYLRSFFIGIPSTAPSISLGAGAGVGATASILRGNDNIFTISVIIGTGATANDTIADITYGTVKGATPSVLWSPSDTNSLNIVGTNQSVLAFTVSASTCRLRSGANGLSNGASYIWTIFSA